MPTKINIKSLPTGYQSIISNGRHAMEGDLTDEQRAELLREADACYVHRMIKGEWAIENAVHLAGTIEATT